MIRFSHQNIRIIESRNCTFVLLPSPESVIRLCQIAQKVIHSSRQINRYLSGSLFRGIKRCANKAVPNGKKTATESLLHYSFLYWSMEIFLLTITNKVQMFTVDNKCACTPVTYDLPSLKTD